MSDRKRNSTNVVGFLEARRRAIRALAGDERVTHELRESREEKNLLATGVVSPEFVSLLLSRCTGAQYTRSVHHLDRATPVHIFQPTVRTEGVDHRWYIKVYFGQSTVFISVHQSRRSDDLWQQ